VIYVWLFSVFFVFCALRAAMWRRNKVYRNVHLATAKLDIASMIGVSHRISRILYGWRRIHSTINIVLGIIIIIIIIGTLNPALISDAQQHSSQICWRQQHQSLYQKSMRSSSNLSLSLRRHNPSFASKITSLQHLRPAENLKHFTTL